jgi:DNA-binding SARP family transcriptional activator
MTPSHSDAPARATLTLLRDFELRYDNEHVDVAPCAQRLIGFLAFQDGRPVRRTYVSGTLWSESSDAHAQASLRTALWRSPVCGAEPLVRASGTHLWLSPRAEIDVRTATARAHQLLGLHAIDPTSIDVMAEVAAYGHDVLVGWYDEWVDSERERFRQLRLHVLDQLGELLLRAHRYAEAVEVALVALASDELRESAHRLLVRAHLCEGNIAEAMRQYRSYATRLAAQLGVRPSATMEELISAATSAAARVPRSGGATHRAATA